MTAFCRLKRYDLVYLWTFKGLDTARHLYEKNGFRLAQEKAGNQWGTTVVEQKFMKGPQPSKEPDQGSAP